jgi:RNA polymerase sigma-70 factor, ECF subfamily
MRLLRHHPLPGRPLSATDADYAAAAAQGNRDALAALYARHADAVYSLALRLLQNTADAEDVLQDVFVGLPRALGRYTEHGTFAAWLKRIAARASIARNRNRPTTDELTPDFPSPSSDPGLRIDLDAAIASLPESLRTPFVLRAVDGFTHDEIAALLDISTANAMQRFSRACRQLRTTLDPAS